MQLLDAPSIYPGTTAKNFKCEKCDNQYVYQTGLNKHMLNKHVK